MTRTAPLLHAASLAASRGQWPEAERLWTRVLEAAPDHPAARHGLGVVAFQRGELDAARGHLAAAHAVAPRDTRIAMSLADVLRELGDGPGELRAIDAAIAADPYLLAALLARGECLEKLGRRRAAASAYMNALAVAPSEVALPPALRAKVMHARRIAQAHGRELSEFLADRMGMRISRLTPAEAERWREAGAIMSGQSKPYLSRCNRLYIPRLPAIPFFDRSQFDWVEALEARTADITRELQALLASDTASFRPYVAYDEGTPVNQWKELNHSLRWSSYFLWRDGQSVVDAQAKCPITVAALREVEMAEIGGLCPNAMFSALAPHTHIPPHTGETNARAIVHLPLVVPNGCSYRVGFEQREWKVGEVLIFDDTIEHEARNDSDDLRVVLIFDVWNPLLSPGEREMMQALSAAAREFHDDSVAHSGEGKTDTG